MKIKSINRKGFTLIELLVVMSVAALLFGLSTPLFNNVLFYEDLNASAKEVLSGIRNAQSRTINGKEGTIYGIRFDTSTNPDRYIIFRGNTFNPSAPTNEVYTLSSRINFSNISLNGGSVNLIFDEYTGNTSNFGNIVLSNENESVTISISQLGYSDVQ